MQSVKKPKITVIGSMIFDFVAGAERLPRKGETVLGTSFGMFTGGKGANQAVQAGRLGADVSMVGRIGCDFMGDRILKSLEESGVRTEFVLRDERASTSACCIHVDAAGDNAIVISPDANMACLVEDIERARGVILSSDLVVFQLEIAMEAIEHAVRMVSDAGIPSIMNPAPANRVSPWLFSLVDMLTPNETEAEFFSGVSIPVTSDDSLAWENAAADSLLAMGPEAVIITLGKRGAFLAYGSGRKLVPTFTRIKAVDTTAAGDAFNGALAVALAEGRTLDEAVVFANAAGSLAASRRGAQSSLCTRRELEDFLNEENVNAE